MTLTINGEKKNFEKTSLNITNLLGLLDLPLDHIAVELNRSIIPKTQFAETQLAEEDVIEIVRFVGGG